MDQLNKEIIKKLTRLCRIDCTEDEQDALLIDLQKIIGYIELLQEIDTENIEPCSHVVNGMSHTLRDDEIGETMKREDFLANAPSHIGGMVRVPPILKKEG